MKKKVSIILPCYNQGIYLAEALDSVISQTYQDWEAIIINDGSTDNTESIALQYTTKDARIHYLFQENRGVSAARNRGIKHASGEFILPLDPDDIIAPTFIEKCIKEFNLRPNSLLVYTQTSLFGVQKGVWNLPAYDTYKKFLLGNCIVCTSLFRKEDCLKVGGYDENMHIGLEDWEFYIRLLQLNKKVYHIPEPLFFYRIKELSRSTECNKSDKLRQVLIYIYKKHLDTYISYYGFPFDNFQQIESLKHKLARYHSKWYRKLWYKITFKKVPTINI